MTQTPARFCGSCGAELSPGVSFCTACGAPVASSAAAPPPVVPPGPMPEAEYLETGSGPAPPRRVVVAVVAGVVLVLVAASAAAWWLFARGVDDGYAAPLPGAVTEEPELDWSWEAEGGLVSVVGLGDDSFALSSEGDVTLLDENGEDRWTTNVSGATFAFAPPSREDQILVPATDAESVTALSADDGDELWTVDGSIQQVTDDYLFMVDDEQLTAVALEDGDEQWSVSVEGNSFGTSVDAAYVVEDGELRRLRADDGDEEWAVEIDLDDASHITGAEGFVVVQGGTQVAAYDAGDGEELWTTDAGEDGSTVGLMSAQQVFVAPNDFGSEDDEITVLVYDRDGRVGSVRTESYFYAFPVRSGREVYAVDYAAGAVYDKDLDLLGRAHEGRIDPAEGGLYEMEDGELSWFGFEDEEPVWTLSEEFSEDARVAAADDRVHVLDGDEVLTYR